MSRTTANNMVICTAIFPIAVVANKKRISLTKIPLTDRQSMYIIMNKQSANACALNR